MRHMQGHSPSRSGGPSVIWSEMPRKPHSPCPVPGCPVLTRGGRCARHRQQYEKQRGTRHERGYDHQHEQWRAEVLKRDPVCTYCRQAPSTDGDHIKPVRDYPELRLDVSNGRGACNPCHMRHGSKAGGEHREFSGRGGGTACRADFWAYGSGGA